MKNEILENEMIEFLASAFPRSSMQRNALHEADAEIVRIEGSDIALAFKVDSVVEEIESGLYSDPGTIGWMTVTSSVSDLAAVGAQPIGILISETLPPRYEKEKLIALQAGIREACDAYGIHVFGGDTNFSQSMQLSTFAVGIISDGPTLMRIGCRPGDVLFASGPLGRGSVFAFDKLIRKTQDSVFKPMARVKEGILLRQYASCCMDTSDGALATIDQLSRLNRLGFSLSPFENWLENSAGHLAVNLGFPAWMMLAGPHGEFELIFTILGEKIDIFLLSANKMGWNPIQIGKAISRNRVEFTDSGATYVLPTGKIRNLFTEVGGDIEKYIGGLLKIRPRLSSESMA